VGVRQQWETVHHTSLSQHSVILVLTWSPTCSSRSPALSQLLCLLERAILPLKRSRSYARAIFPTRNRMKDLLAYFSKLQTSFQCHASQVGDAHALRRVVQIGDVCHGGGSVQRVIVKGDGVADLCGRVDWESVQQLHVQETTPTPPSSGSLVRAFGVRHRHRPGLSLFLGAACFSRVLASFPYRTI